MTPSSVSLVFLVHPDRRFEAGARRTARRVSLAVASLMLIAGLTFAAGCGPKKVDQPPPTPPQPAFAGPEFLHGTVSSLCTIRGYQPQFVSGFGLVVNLRGTGSGEVPSALRQWMLNEMRKMGVGKLGSGPLENVNPAAMLDSDRTAVVSVQGVIPPGATGGTTFDVLVSALPQSQTTSLKHGQLWTTNLSPGVADPARRFVRSVAKANGPVYIDPIDEAQATGDEIFEHHRQAVVLAGGTVSQDRRLQLVLRQPNWARSALIADRINTRFRAGLTDASDTAEAQDDTVIRLNVPDRYHGDTERFLSLVSYLFIQEQPGFARSKAEQLGTVLEAEPRYAESVAKAWQGLGKTVLPVVRRYYDPEQLEVSLAALEAGVRMEDERAAVHLEQLALHDDASVRRRAGELLVHLPRSLRGARALADLIDDPDQSVRIAAYESLVGISDPLINRVVFADPPVNGAVTKSRFKFALDLIPAEKSLVYITHHPLPRIAIFSPNTTFQFPALIRLWDNSLMVRGSGPEQAMEVFYQPRGADEPRNFEIAPTLANLILLLAHDPSAENPTEGLDLSYAEVVDAVFQIAAQNHLASPLEINRSELVERLDRRRSQLASQGQRPETDRGDTDLSENIVERPDLSQN